MYSKAKDLIEEQIYRVLKAMESLDKEGLLYGSGMIRGLKTALNIVKEVEDESE